MTGARWDAQRLLAELKKTIVRRRSIKSDYCVKADKQSKEKCDTCTQAVGQLQVRNSCPTAVEAPRDARS